MSCVAEQKPKPMLARRQRDLRLGLAGAEVQMLEIVRNRLSKRRQVGVHQQMMMPRIRLVEAGGRDAHVQQTESDDRVGADVVAGLWINKKHLRILRRRSPAAAC